MTKKIEKADKPKLHPKLARLVHSIDERTQIRDVFVTPNLRIDSINTGSTVLNMLIGGSRTPDGSFVCPGWPKGRIVEIYGRESCGKTTLALSAMAQAIFNGGKKDGSGLYVDLECAVVDAYSKKIGVDFTTGQALRAQPRTFEETEALVTNAALNGIEAVVVDSVAGLVSTREAKRDTSDDEQKQGVAEIPRLMSNWMPKLQNIISRTGTVVIFLNQTRDKIGAKGFTEEALKSTTGGNALKFWASVRILLKPTLSTKAKRWNPITKQHEDVQIATDVIAKVIKNKVDAKQGHTGLFTIRYGTGVDELATMMNVAEAYQIVKKSRPKNKDGSDKKSGKAEIISFTGAGGESVEALGIEKFRVAISRNRPLLEEMLGLCQVRLVEGYEMLSDEELADLAEGAVAKREDEDDDYVATDAPRVEYEEQDSPDDDALPDPVEVASSGITADQV